MKTSHFSTRNRCAVVSLVVLFGGLAATPSWATEPAQTLSLQPLPFTGGGFALVADDVDQDGRIDLVVTNRSAATVQVLYQKTPRQFEAGPASKVLGFHANELTRLPGDAPRYVLSAEGQHTLKVLEPDGEGGMREAAQRRQGAPFTSTVFSWPGWGEISLAVAPYMTEALTLLRDFQPETAQAEAEFFLGVPGHSVPGQVTAVDLNGDGIVELLYTTRRSGTVWRIDHPKDDVDPEPVELWKAPVGAPRHLVVADLNDNGAPDILLPLESERRIATLLNDGQGNFTPGPELPVPSTSWGPARLAIAEDRDGSWLLVADTEQSLMFYRIEKGHPERYQTIEWPMPASLNQLRLLDVDGDGELDVVVVMSRVKDSVGIVYGPLWKTLARERDVAESALAAAAARGEIKIFDDPERVLAQVGEHPITVADVRQFVMESGMGQDLQSPAGRSKILRMMIEELLLKQAVARDLGLSELPSFEEYSAGLKRLQEQHFPMPPPPDEDVVRDYYEANQETYGIPEMVRLVQIQFRFDRDQAGRPTARQRAEQALQRLEAGEDFAMIAAALTENPRAATMGPDRGFVARNVESWLRDALRDLSPGQRTGIVESPVGYEILLITDWRAPIIAEFDAVSAKVAGQWRVEQQQQARDRYLKKLAGQFGVTVQEKELESANPAID
ncbi:MAG: hypothetical protein EA420_16270 [Candidatus Competibacteraceae bacterium]|nr:MAG: hypothetical protein EA420_16270 [Candidatus Competibacteraceae bacterium]